MQWTASAEIQSVMNASIILSLKLPFIMMSTTNLARAKILGNWHCPSIWCFPTCFLLPHTSTPLLIFPCNPGQRLPARSIGMQQGPQRHSVPGMPQYDHHPNLNKSSEDLEETVWVGRACAVPLPSAAHIVLTPCCRDSPIANHNTCKTSALPHFRRSFMRNQMQVSLKYPYIYI